MDIKSNKKFQALTGKRWPSFIAACEKKKNTSTVRLDPRIEQVHRVQLPQICIPPITEHPKIPSIIHHDNPMTNNLLVILTLILLFFQATILNRSTVNNREMSRHVRPISSSRSAIWPIIKLHSIYHAYNDIPYNICMRHVL